MIEGREEEEDVMKIEGKEECVIETHSLYTHQHSVEVEVLGCVRVVATLVLELCTAVDQIYHLWFQLCVCVCVCVFAYITIDLVLSLDITYRCITISVYTALSAHLIKKVISTSTTHNSHIPLYNRLIPGHDMGLLERVLLLTSWF